MTLSQFCRYLYVVLFSFIICHYSYAWFAYDLWSGTIFAVLGLLTYICVEIGFKDKKQIGGMTIGFYVILCVTGFYTDGELWAVIRNGIAYLMILSIFRLSNGDAKWVLRRLTIIFGIALSFSFLFYILNMIHIPLPTISFSKVLYYNFTNHILWIDLDIMDYFGTFTGFCLEPGYLSLLCVCILVANQFDFRNNKILYVFLICILFSASLGGFVLFVAGYIAKVFLEPQNRHKKKIIFMTLISVFIFVYIAMNYNGGDNIIVNRVLGRTFLYNSGVPFISNRENDVAEFYINRYFYSSDVWWGIGSQQFQRIKMTVDNWDACSWRIFVVVYGVIYTMTFMILYHLVFRNRVPKHTYIIAIVVLLLDFYQHGTFFNESLFLYILLFMSVDNYGRKKYLRTVKQR